MSKHDSTRGFTRRDVLVTGASGIVLLGTGALTGPLAQAATPKQGGHLRLGMGSGSTSDSLDPATFDSTFNQVLGYGCLRNSLTQVTNTNQLGPELAVSWESSPDAKTWIFTLRSGVEFHNGKTLTVEDVIVSINHHRKEDSKSAAKALLTAITDIRGDGTDKVVFELDGGNADFPFLMSDYHLCILPTKDGVVDATSGVGTGPFVLETFEPGVRAAMKRNPNYFKEGQPHFDSVEMLAIHDVVARTNALNTNEIDWMERCDLKTVHLLKRNRNLTITQVDGTQHYSIPMHTNVAPFDNNDVRLALKYAIDRETLLETILRGYGAVGNDHPIGRANRFHANELEQRTYDPDKAKFHLKQAGLDSLSVDLSAADAAFAGAVDAAILFKEHASKAGIDINVIREPSDGYWSNVWLKKPFCMCYWGGRPTEDLMFSTAYAKGVPWNDTYWDHERFNKLLVEARAELDEAKRREMYVEMQRIVKDEAGTIVPLFASYVDAHQNTLTHEESIGGNYALDGFKLAERWWFN